MRSNLKNRFRPKRLTQAREARELTRVALAEKIGAAPSSISEYEAGRKTPSPEVGKRLAKALDLPLAFFLNPSAIADPKAVFFRARLTTAKKSILAARAKLDWYREIIAFAESALDLPAINLPNFSEGKPVEQLSDSDIESFAMEARRFFGLGDRAPISNMALLLENNGVVIAHGSVANEKLDSFSISPASGRPIVFLSLERQTAVRWRFDLAHELAHMILHADIEQDLLNDHSTHKLMERQANLFAGAFLLPDSGFAQELYAPTLTAFKNLKKRWKTSIAAMIMRSKQLGFLDDKQAQRAWLIYSRRGWRRVEPFDDEMKIETPRLFRRCIEVLVDSFYNKKELMATLPYSPKEIEIAAGLKRGYFGEPEEIEMPEPKIKHSGSGKVYEFPPRKQ